MRKTINGERVTTEEGQQELEDTLNAITYIFPTLQIKEVKCLAALYLEITRDEELTFWLVVTNLIQKKTHRIFSEHVSLK